MHATERAVSMLIFHCLRAANYKATFVSVDVPVLGCRLNEMRNSFTLPEEMQFPEFLSNGRKEFSGDNELTASGKNSSIVLDRSS